MSVAGGRLAFPAGHYAGERPDDEQHRVRLGWSTEVLTESEFAIWVLAHGPARGGKATWTVDEVLAVAEQTEVEDVVPAGESLLKRGLLVAVPDGPANEPATTAFLREHVVRSLLVGIGDTPENPGIYGVGVPGTKAVAWLDADAFELWQWGPVTPSLWQVCEARAAVSTELGEPLQAADTVGGLLGDLRLLLSNSCAYLDVATP